MVYYIINTNNKKGLIYKHQRKLNKKIGDCNGLEFNSKKKKKKIFFFFFFFY